MNQYCFLNGDVIPLAKARISVMDIGLLRGYGIYDGLAVINGKPLRFEDHWQRFMQGAETLRIDIPITKDLVENKIIEIMNKSGLSERVNVRMILTGGQAIKGIDFNPHKPTFFITVEKWESLPKENYENGVKLVSQNYKREMPKIKTLNYIMAVNLQDFKKEHEATEILYVYNNMVLECATSNIFIVKNNKIVTPDTNVLEGITRKIILELLGNDYQIEKRKAHAAELHMADEIFIASSFRDIVPIIQIDDYKIADGMVGPITKDLMRRFRQYIGLQTI